MQPHIISHILITVPAQVTSAEPKIPAARDEYESIRKYFGGDAWLADPASMLRYSDTPPFSNTDQTPAGCQPVFVARRAESYVISADPTGQLSWSSNEIGDDHLICLLSQQVSHAYLRMLHQTGISYVVAGWDRIDIATAFSELCTYFGIHTLLLKGESPVSRHAMQVGLVDEVSISLPGIGANTRQPSIGKQCSDSQRTFLSEAQACGESNHDVLWVRYDVICQRGRSR